MTIPTPAQVRDWLHTLPDLCALLGGALVTRSAEQYTSRPSAEWTIIWSPPPALEAGRHDPRPAITALADVWTPKENR